MSVGSISLGSTVVSVAAGSVVVRSVLGALVAGSVEEGVPAGRSVVEPRSLVLPPPDCDSERQPVEPTTSAATK
ncbi:hypothetical protein BRC80_08330 [Halobacteriales archaeon QH_9_66_26]|nr:MAG: hypothetical protein BRC80_08330 [Halobacteriales archaeon QH_9_66_26]